MTHSFAFTPLSGHYRARSLSDGFITFSKTSIRTTCKREPLGSPCTFLAGPQFAALRPISLLSGGFHLGEWK